MPADIETGAPDHRSIAAMIEHLRVKSKIGERRGFAVVVSQLPDRAGERVWELRCDKCRRGFALTNSQYLDHRFRLCGC